MNGSNTSELISEFPVTANQWYYVKIEAGQAIALQTPTSLEPKTNEKALSKYLEKINIIV